MHERKNFKHFKSRTPTHGRVLCHLGMQFYSAGVLLLLFDVMTTFKHVAVGAVALTTTLLLAACGGQQNTASQPTNTPPAASSQSTQATQSVTLQAGTGKVAAQEEQALQLAQQFVNLTDSSAVKSWLDKNADTADKNDLEDFLTRKSSGDSYSTPKDLFGSSNLSIGDYADITYAGMIAAQVTGDKITDNVGKKETEVKHNSLNLLNSSHADGVGLVFILDNGTVKGIITVNNVGGQAKLSEIVDSSGQLSSRSS